jgi:hypothetical protein
MIKRLALGAALIMALSAASCDPAADVAARNISTAADNFEIPRRITFYNGITDNVVLVVEGYCSLGNKDTDLRMSVTCKTGRDAYVRHFAGLSDNMFFIAEQLEGVSVSTFHHRTVFRPQSLIPDVDLQGSLEELVTDKNAPQQ